MPGRMFLTTPIGEIAKALGAELSVEAQPPRYNIAPGQNVVTLQDGRLSLMRWGMIPVGRVNARGRPVMETIVNARSETVFDKSAFDGVGRAIVPADGWYEWTGKTGRKQPWRLSSVDGSVLFFAAITDVWQAPGDVLVPQVATVTCEPNAQVREIHHRMGVILRVKDVPLWLSGSKEDAQALMRPLADGGISIEKADDIDWDKP